MLTIKNNKKPQQVSIKGINLYNVLTYSVSNKWLFCKLTKLTFDKNNVPGPIIQSFKINPTKILPNDNKNKGKAIKKGDSCKFSIYFRNIFGFVKNTKNKIRIE